MASRGRKTANSQGRRKGRITRSMASEANSEEAVTPQQSAELGEARAGEGRPTWRVRALGDGGDLAVRPGAGCSACLCLSVPSCTAVAWTPREHCGALACGHRP